MLSSKERVLMALNHEEPDRIPLGAERGGLNPPAFIALREYLGITDLELHQKLSQYADIRSVNPGYTELRTLVRTVPEEIPLNLIENPCYHLKKLPS
jgi:hypothetical protein